jgi:orotate phosphoribosyltransferase
LAKLRTEKLMTSSMYDREALKVLVREKALRFGEFTLASGKKASYYLDCRQITLDSQGARLIGEGMLELLADDMPELVGGMAIGADPITAAILTLAGVRGVPLRGVMVRKEAKQHGTGKFVEGPFREGERVVIVEDVVTTGGSSLAAIERCEAVELKVERVLAIIDRLEGGREAFAAKGYELTTLFTVRDFGIGG